MTYEVRLHQLGISHLREWYQTKKNTAKSHLEETVVQILLNLDEGFPDSPPCRSLIQIHLRNGVLLLV